MAIVINGSGTVTGISVGGLPDGIVDDGTLADNAVGLAQMAGGTDGNIITYDTSGNPAVVASGTSGHFLKSQGADTVPVFAAAGGGKILQVVGSVDGDYTQISSTSYTSTDQELSITPTLDTSKILVLYNGHYSCNSTSGSANFQVNVTVYRGVTDLGLGNGTGFHYNYINGTYDSKQFSVSLLDSPETTSAITYGIYAKMLYTTNAMRFNPGGNATFTLLEIGA